MSIVKMKRLRVIGLEEERDALLQQLLRLPAGVGIAQDLTRLLADEVGVIPGDVRHPGGKFGL